MIEASVVADGSLLIALPIAAAAGLVSFLSPCVLPLVPGYLSYVTGLTGADLGMTPAAKVPATVGAQTGQPGGGDVAVRGTPAAAPIGGETTLRATVRTSRVLAGTLGFVAGFSVIFVAYGALFGALGAVLLGHQELIQRVAGVLVIGLGLMFAGWLPGMTREFRLHRAPTIGVWGSPLLGALFGLGWTPCIGPTLAAVQTLAFTEGSALRGAILSLAYCAGLGLPFVLLGLAFRRLAGALAWVRGHYLLVMRIGGVMLIAVGLALVTGVWNDLTTTMRVWTGSYEVPL